MKIRNITFWILAVIITLAAAKYQRATGPTHPLQGEVVLGDAGIKYELRRSSQQKEAPVELLISDPNVTGVLSYKRYKSQDAWTEIPMQRQGNVLLSALPVQPPAGKLEYFVRLTREDKAITIPPDRDVVIRFTGDVPSWVLIPHILLMFLSMLVSTRAGLEAIPKNGNPRKYAFWALGILFVGGMIFGPLVQKYAFGAYWTGFPFGFDLTDNKTLIAFVGWVVAIAAVLLKHHARTWIVIASILLMLAFSIPHSMLGSELNYQTGQVETSK